MENSTTLWEGYSSMSGFLDLVLAIQNNPAKGTNINRLVSMAHNQLGSEIPEIFVQYNVGYQNNIFGDYPTHDDLVPSMIFCVVFAIIFILHTVLFVVNFSRGHYFWLTLLWMFYSILRVIAWALRYQWGLDITKTAIGITSEVLAILPTIVLITSNLVLAQRLFTWRHPVGGSRKLFTNIMLGHYILVLGIIGMTIAASAIPYIHFLSESSYSSYKKAVQASSILIVLYTLTAASLIGLSYFFSPTAKDENLYTYQPWWIESFNPLYFVKANAAREAEETFVKRNHNHRHAIRVIAATHHHYKMVEGLTNQRGNLKHNFSLAIIFVSTIFLMISSIGRCIVTFQARYQYQSSPACKPVFAYICWGLFEVIINALYLVGRVDLRFYRPDVLPQKIRSIITAEQSFFHPSVVPSDDESEIGTDEMVSVGSPRTPFTNDQKLHFELESSNDYSQFSTEKETNDDESNFHF